MSAFTPSDMVEEILADLCVTAKRDRDTAEKRYKEVCREFIDSGLERIDGEQGHVTRVEPTKVELDEVKLRKALTDEQWSAITKSVPDDTLIEAAVTRGVIDPKVVARCMEVVNKTPYAKVTSK